jgi:hypothetical protein
MTWTEVKQLRRDNGQPLHSACNYSEAGDRLTALVDGLPDAGGLQDLVKWRMFKFRVTDGARLWGYLDGGVFFPLWWDPEHRL